MARKRASRTKGRSRPTASKPFPADTVQRSVGIFLVAVAALTLFGLLSLSRGVVTEQWLRLLRMAFGWGIFFTPLLIGGVGIWLFLRSFGIAPSPDWETWGGIAIVLFMLLGLFHAFADDPQALANKGGGGGYVGLYLRQALSGSLGHLGMYVILFTGLIIGLVMAFDISFVGALKWLREMVRSLAERYRGWRQSRGHMPAPPKDTSLPARFLEKLKPERKAEPEETTVGPSPTPSAPPGPKLLQPRVIGEKGGRWQLPPLASILEDNGEQDFSQAEIRHRVRIIEETLLSFGVPGKVTEVNQGPTVTQFGFEPGYVERRDKDGQIRRVKVKVNQVSALNKDLELALAASPIRIEAPVPGRSVVGIEVPNSQTALVSLRGVMESEEFKNHRGNLVVALGRDVSGQPIVADLAAMPHLLVAGATGSGKSVCINALISCLLCTHTPDDLRLILVDPKMVELVNYNGIPHLLSPVIIEAAKVVDTLKWATREMERRYRLFSRAGARNLEAYNRQAEARGEQKLPFIVIFIDELADIMMVAPEETERYICRIAQMARATGIHLVIATQRPSVDVVTGLIKANFPARISFAVTSLVDSRVILDVPGAEQLLGSGDMLYMAPDTSKLVRAQGCWVSDAEIERLVRYWKGLSLERSLPEDELLTQQPLWQEAQLPPESPTEEDDLLEEAVKVVCEQKRASISLLQRRLRIGYSRAARLIDIMEEKGIVGPAEGASRARQVLVDAKNYREKLSAS